MNKKIKTTDLNLNVYTGTMIYVDIDIFRFLYDEEILCLTIQILNGENFEFYKEVDLPEGEVIVDHNDLKRFALNWIFENVEIVKEAPVVPAQEQYEFIPSTSEGICTGEPCRKPD
ncbi:ubiquitin [Clostridium botulinum]|uniref:ubiquitin n=1 Tax=Clostridium botulinum TaxID=1491 RepID=UPI001C9B4FDF|nr:ubiquitin [Clostridium botulinum]MBY6900236.1 ubiquitin [Clostridium botulinum]MBY6914349.1 ubiquitin [Clostridium botulinum]